MISAVILAGAPAGDLGNDPHISRAMIKIGNKTMIDRVAESVVDNADETFIVGEVETEFNAIILKPKGSLVDNLKVALEKVKGDYILLSTSDIPLVTAESVREFIGYAADLDADFVYPICPKANCIELYPNLKRTYVTIKDGTFTGGNMMFMKKDFLVKLLPFMKNLYEYRKSPVKLAKLIGFDIIFKLALCKICPSFLNIKTLEKKISKLFDAEVRALILKNPAIFEDLDSGEELTEFKKIISGEEL